jgi:hypothetical protein
MKKIENATIYHCDFCSKVSISKSGMSRHEISCKKNPNNKTPCASCQHCIKDFYFVIDNDYTKHYTEEEIENLKEDYDFKYDGCFALDCHKVTDFKCAIDNTKMFHNKVNALSKEKRDEIVSRCDKQMPQECTCYKSIYDF